MLDRYRNLQGSQTTDDGCYLDSGLDRYRNLQGSQTIIPVELMFYALDRYRNLQGSQTKALPGSADCSA